MSDRRSIIHSDTETDDEQLFTSATTSHQQHEQILLRPVDKSMVDIDSTNGKESETTCLLDEVQVEPSITSTYSCSNTRARYVIAIWAFFGFLLIYAQRVNISVAIVAMVAPQSALNQSIQSCPSPHVNSTTPPSKYEFQWSPTIQGFVLGGFFYGYIVMQIIGGNLAEKFGAKWIFGGCILFSSVLTLLTPLAARTHFGLLIFLRVLTGLVSGPVFPSASALWGRWIPPSERSTIPPASQNGATFGIIVATPLITIMIDKNFLGGWPSAFYVFGALSCLWVIGWYFFGFNSPDDHPRISREERHFLNKHTTGKTRKHHHTPWSKIFSCPSVYAIAAMQFCNNYIFYTIFTSLPTYFATILNFDLNQNGWISALPYVSTFLVTIISGVVADRIRARNLVSITVLRKAQTIIGTVGTCSFLVAIGYMGCNPTGAVICCIIAVGFLGIHSCGAFISHLDIASNYAGTLLGITNSLGSISGFVAPYVVGAITNNNQTVHAWQIIFNISAGFGVFSCLVFCLVFNGEEQPWNRTPEARERHESSLVVTM